VLVLLVTQLPRQSMFLPLAVVLVLLASALFVLRVRPYLLRFNNVLEVVLMLHLALSFVFGVLAQSLVYRSANQLNDFSMTASSASVNFLSLSSVRQVQFILNELSAVLLVFLFLALELFARCCAKRVAPNSFWRNLLM
jgi:hypothetical protein